MNRDLCITLLVCAVFTAVSIAGAAGGALKYHAVEGDKAVYLLNATIKTSMVAPEIKENATESVQIKYGLEFTKVLGMGRMQITSRVLQGTAKVSSGGESETQPLDNSESLHTLTTLGDMKNVEIITGEPLILPFSLSSFTPMQVFLPGQLPRKLVKTGDSWQGKHQVETVAGQTEQVPYTSKVLGETTYAGRKCLKIKTDYRLFKQSDIPVSGLENKVSGKIMVTGSTVWLFDPEAGLALKSTENYTAKITYKVEKLGTATITITSEIHGRLEAWNGEKLVS